MLTVPVVEPEGELLVAVTVYTVAGSAALGMPLITPVLVLKVRPAPNAGLIL